MHSLAPSAAFTALQQEPAAAGRASGQFSEICRQGRWGGRARGALVMMGKQQVYSNVAVAMVYYFPFFPFSHCHLFLLGSERALLLTQLFFREGIRENGRGGRGRQQENASKPWEGWEESHWILLPQSSVCEHNSTSGLHCFFLGVLCSFRVEIWIWNNHEQVVSTGFITAFKNVTAEGSKTEHLLLNDNLRLLTPYKTTCESVE